MSKKMKLNLGELKVTSFLTSLERNEVRKLRGGGPDTEQECSVDSCTCGTFCECVTVIPNCTNTCESCTVCPPPTFKTEC